ncbi:MAG: PCP reductase family protein [Cyanobacteria bacterium P01_A01_bin.84]
MNNSNLPETLRWTTKAKAKLKHIPFFVRSQAQAKIEHFARISEQEIVTLDVVEQARIYFGQ